MLFARCSFCLSVAVKGMHFLCNCSKFSLEELKVEENLIWFVTPCDRLFLCLSLIAIQMVVNVGLNCSYTIINLIFQPLSINQKKKKKCN